MRGVIKDIWYQVESIVETEETGRGKREVNVEYTRIENKRGPNSMTHDNRKTPSSLTTNAGSCEWHDA